MEIEFRCAIHANHTLDARWRRYGGKFVGGEIEIVTCPDCLEEAREEAREEGRKEVKDENMDEYGGSSGGDFI